tara:strand:+ start:309 stop:575 length:267 start_codon:yes stop_codon:yes gene_type:complete
MTHPFICFPAPSDKVVELAKLDSNIPAAKVYRAETTATLLDGTVVRPSLRLAYNVVRCLKLGMPPLLVSVEEGFYVLDSHYNEARDYP